MPVSSSRFFLSAFRITFRLLCLQVSLRFRLYLAYVLFTLRFLFAYALLLSLYKRNLYNCAITF